MTNGWNLVDRVELAPEPLQLHAVDAGAQHLDRDSLLPQARAAAEIDHALAALAQPREKLEAAQAQRIARLERLGRHDLSGIASKSTLTLP